MSQDVDLKHFAKCCEDFTGADFKVRVVLRHFCGLNFLY